MIAIIFIFTACWCITILAAARYVFAPVPAGLLSNGPLSANSKDRLCMINLPNPTRPKLARSISFGLLLAIQQSVRKI